MRPRGIKVAKLRKSIPALMVLLSVSLSPQAFADSTQKKDDSPAIIVQYQPISMEDRVNTGRSDFVELKTQQVESDARGGESPTTENTPLEDVHPGVDTETSMNSKTSNSIKKAQEALTNLDNFLKLQEEQNNEYERLRRQAEIIDGMNVNTNTNNTTVYNDSIGSSQSGLPPVLSSQLNIGSSSADIPDEVKGTVIEKVIKAAYSQLGVPYVWGGTSPGSGLDCSGFTQYIYKEAGISLPRVTYQQVNAGKSVSLNDLKPGDLLFPADTSHVSVYIGNGNVIHAPQTGDVVKITPAKYMSVAKAIRIV